MAIALNIEPMPPRPLSVNRFSALEISAETSADGLAHQGDGAGLDAEPLEKFALRDRAVDPRAEIFRRPRQRLEIDMGGDVGLPGILQRVGETVTGDGLESVAGIAAQYGRNR